MIMGVTSRIRSANSFMFPHSATFPSQETSLDLLRTGHQISNEHCVPGSALRKRHRLVVPDSEDDLEK